MGKTIYIPGMITSPQGLADGTWKVTLRFNELPPEKIGQLASLNQKFVYFGIKEEGFKNEEKEMLESLESDESIGKTQAQRLRAVLYRNWQQNPEGFPDSETHYRAKMERLIEHLKNKLE